MINYTEMLLVLFPYFIFLLLFVLVFCLIKIKFFSKFFKVIFENKFFFLILFVLFISLIIKEYPFKTQVYFDEHNYLLGAQNFFELGKPFLCNARIDNTCILSDVPPHGLGVTSIYSIFYSYDFDLLYLKVNIFNILLCILSSVLVFMIAQKLFDDKNVARISAFLILFLPYNFIYSTSVMPANLCKFFLILFVNLFFIFLKDKKDLRKYLVTSILISLVLLSSFRIEYAALLTVILIYFCYLYFKQKKFFYFSDASKSLLMMFLIFVLFVSYSYSVFYFDLKIIKNDSSIGQEFFNFSYFEYFIMNPLMILCTSSFIFYLIFFFIQDDKNSLKHRFHIFLMLLFLCTVLFYSFYNFPYEYRYLIPISFVYVLFASAGFMKIINFIFKKQVFRSILVSTLMVILLFMSMNEAVKIKENESNKEAEYFLKMIDKDNLRELGILNENSLFLFGISSYLAQISRLENYAYDLNLNLRSINNYIFYYIDTPFRRFEETEFNDPERYDYKLITTDPKSGFSIYQIFVK